MKVVYSQQHKKFRIIIPPAMSETGRRQCRFFDSAEEAHREAKQWERNRASAPKVSKTEEAAIILAKNLGLSEHQFLEAMQHYKKTVLAVKRPGITIKEAAVDFVEAVKREKNIRTFYKYNSTLKRLTELVGENTPIVELTREALEQYLDSFGPGTTRRTQYANVKRFINWSLEKGYLSVDPIADSKPKDAWGSNDEPLGIDDFRRILFVVAGIEAPAPGEQPTMHFFRLLPFYVLGGLAGLRRAEIISSYANDPVIEWRDVDFEGGWIEVRDEVAKQTLRKNKGRYVPLEPAAGEWLRRIPVRTDRIMEISQSTLQRLNQELLHKLDIKVPDNGLRNGYATWSATFRTKAEVADNMGDLVSTIERYYIKRRKPESGRAWFNIRPTMGRKIVPMEAAV